LFDLYGLSMVLKHLVKDLLTDLLTDCMIYMDVH